MTDDPARLDPALGARALLFDCDGTLVDTMHLHRIVWHQLFGRYGFEITDEWWEEYANVALGPFVRAAVPDADDVLAEQLLEEGNALYLDALHLLQPIEHVVEIAREHHGRVPMAVVTGGFRDVVVPTLDTVGIAGLFDVIVTADDVVHSKPAPDLYQRAMELLGVRPEECIVYEDSEIGMASARAAGISAVIDIRRVTAP
jgi:beta-phosphoglucomutase-like phosphatase (HAD superfamily)